MEQNRRLIDVNDFKRAFHVNTKENEILLSCGKVFVAFSVVERAIENAHPVDAVEVVRCKDCKHSEIWGLSKSLGGDVWDARVCLFNGRQEWVKDDGFCSDGKPKSERAEGGR